MHSQAGEPWQRDRVFRIPVAKEAVGVTFAERLAAAIGAAQGDRQAAAGSEDRGKCPAAQQMPGQAVLPLIECRLVHEERVKDQRAVKRLQAIPVAQVEGIGWSSRTGGLNCRSRAQRPGPGEVRLHGQAFPVRHLNAEKTGVVVAVADAGVDPDAATELPGRVQHSMPEVESRSGAALVQIAPQLPYVSDW